MTNGRGKSDSSVVPTKSPNNAEGPAAEAMKGRELAKGNSPERNARRTQGQESPPSTLERVRQAASKDREQRFTALFHHVYDVERLQAAFFAIKKDAAAGVDGETWEHYGETLEANLQDLSHRLKRGAYRARTVRRVYIPKVGKAGELRPLGVPALEVDFVAGFEHRHEAERFLGELRERFARFGLQPHADNTRIVEFGRYAEHNRRNRGAGKPETFNFLGFTHSCGKT
jgi:hypothetical protein